MRRERLTQVEIFIITISAFLLITTFSAQTPAWKPVTTEGLKQFSAFYHLQPVLVRGNLFKADNRLIVQAETAEIFILNLKNNDLLNERVDIRGQFIDVGRLEPGDYRLSTYKRPTHAAWPNPGEELIIDVIDLVQVQNINPATSIRSFVLEPERFENQIITVVGQFRGRNLFGDLPSAPRQSRYDFVLKSGEASIWIVGLQPRGKNFNLDINTRVDTNKWLKITGALHQKSGLVMIEGTRIEVTEKQTSASNNTTKPIPSSSSLPPITVVFSDPTPGEIDVDHTKLVRIQFERHIKTSTLTDRVKVVYLDDKQEESDALEWQSYYNAEVRALELKFVEPLKPYSTIRIELLDGIESLDGALVLPWSLTFRTLNKQ
tara:strand:- start:11567 stop:12694 length:1128 start_codon:yes stop_codon:yes gene_type:complete